MKEADGNAEAGQRSAPGPGHHDSTTPQPHRPPDSPRTGHKPPLIPGIVLLAIAFAAGIAMARNQLHVEPVVWIALAMVATIGGWIAHLRWRTSRWTMGLLLLATLACGGAWMTVRHEFISPDDIAAWMGDEQVLVHLRGVVDSAPELKSRTSGSMSRFDYRPPGTYFRLVVTSLIDRFGVSHAARGKAYVRVDGSVAPFDRGDLVELQGFLLRPGPKMNPSEFDFREYAKSLGQAGVLRVPGRDLVRVTPIERSALSTTWLRWRDAARRRAGAMLFANLPGRDRPERQALLSALLLGQREADLDSLNESFRRVGIAHVLAISGLHLGVMAGLVLVLLTLLGVPRRWHGVLLIIVVLAYLGLVEVRLPVLRAGVMTICGALALISGRRLRIGSLVALSAIGLLIWRPDQLFSAGFQLSFGVVLGLILLAPRARERWYGRPDLEAATTSAMVWERMKTVIVAAFVAWMVATPIVLYHFGIFSPLAAPLSILTLPLVTALLALGYLKMTLSILLPSAALLVGVPLAVVADILIALVEGIDAIPLSNLKAPHPPVWWSLAGLGIVVGICLLSGRAEKRWNRLSLAALVALTVALIVPARLVAGRDTLRIDMLAVGDGSCYVLRSAGRTMLFDAGSSTNLDAGRQTIVPALRRLGVTEIDFIAVSHANLDHYSAALEIAEVFRVDRVLVTEAFRREAAADPYGSDAFVLDGLTQLGVSVELVEAGHARSIGAATLTWVHPGAHIIHEQANDNSMVIRAEAFGRSVLMCGDIQAEAIAHLLDGETDVTSDVVELPHHGSHNPMAVQFMRQVSPTIVIQSTAWTRWSRDRWSEELADTTRLVTARDGACWVEIAPDGSITSGPFLDRPRHAEPGANGFTGALDR